MRISDWSSDVCSSDLPDVDVRIAGEHREHVAAQAGEYFRITKHVGHRHRQARNHVGNALVTMQDALSQLADIGEAEVIDQRLHATLEIGRASCRDRVCEYV